MPCSVWLNVTAWSTTLQRNFRLQVMPKAILQHYQKRSEGTPMKGFSAHHTHFLKFFLFPLAYFLPVLYLSFHLEIHFIPSCIQ